MEIVAPPELERKTVMAFILFQRGATSWGFQIGRLYMYWPYLRFAIHGTKPSFGVEEKCDE